MKLNNHFTYRYNIGTYHNKTHKYIGDKDLTTTLNELANRPGDTVAHCKANLMLHLLLWVTNVVEPPKCSRHGLGKHAAFDDRPDNVCRRETRVEKEEFSLSPLKAAPASDIYRTRNALPAPAGSFLAPANVGRTWGDKAARHQLRKPHRADGKSRDGQIDPNRSSVTGTAPDEMKLISAMAAIRRLLQDGVYTLKAFIDSRTSFPIASAMESPPVSAIGHSLNIDHLDNPFYPQENGVAIVNRQNAAVCDFLSDQRANDTDNINFVANLMRDAVSYLASDQKKIHDLAKVLLNSMVYYGGSEGESIPDNVAEMVVRRWMHINVLNDTFENFFAEHIAKYNDLETVSLFSLGTRLNNVLADFTGHIATRGGAAVRRLFGERLWDRAIIPELPVLKYWQETPFNKIRMIDFELGEVQAGLIFARQSGIDFSKVRRGEAVELGEIIQLQVEAGIAPPQWLMFYQFPALVRFIASRGGDSQAAKLYTSNVHAALQYYFAEKERYLQANNPFNGLALAMENYKSRTKLAEEMINKSCPQLSVDEYLLEITPVCLGSAEQSADNYLPVSYIGRSVGAMRAPLIFFYPDQASQFRLPDIDKVFIAQNNAIAEKFSVVDFLLLAHAWSTYFNTNDSYWRDVIVEKYVASTPSINPKFGFKYCQTRWFRESPASYLFSAGDAKIIMHPETELYAMNRFNQDFFYALTRNNEGYRIIYISSLKKENGFKLNDGRVSLCLLKTKAVLSRSQNFEQLIASLVADHSAQLIKKLYDVGYDKHFVHVAKDFFLSLIPFYSCIDGITEDAAEETIFDCALDMVSLVPVLGQINQLLAKSSVLLLKGLHAAGRNALIMSAARYSMKDIAAQSAKIFLAHSLQPASKVISLNEIIALTKGAASFMDPGFELIYFVGKKSFHQAMSVSKHMGKSLPNIKALFERTPSTPSLLQQPSRFDPLFTITEKGTGRKIGIQLLGDQKYRGRGVYAMTNPETGILFGPKLFLTKKNHFKAIPVKFSTRIKIIRHQGLGGKGGPRAASKWNADSPGAAGSSSAAVSAVRPGASSVSYAVNPFKAKLRAFNEHGLFTDKNEIRAMMNDKSTSVIYDLSRNVFYRREDKTRVNTIIEHLPEESFMLNSAGKLEKSKTPALEFATSEEQYDGIKALGIDLAWKNPPIKIAADMKKPIPRKITSIWVGKNDIPEEIIKNLQNNALRAKELPGSYDFKLYLSSENSDAYFRNMARLNELAKNVAVINLEFTDYYHAFSQTKNHEHYLAAIDGNGGQATNFASACDVIRLDLLNRRGGIYLDVDDTLFLSPGLFEYKTNSNGLILSTPVYHDALDMKGKYSNSNWGTHANNPTLGSMLEESYQRYMSHKELYMQRPPIEDEAASAQFASTLSYVTGPDLFNHVIDKHLANEKQTREALKLYNLPIVMDKSTYAKLEEYWDLEVCALKNIVQVGNAHTWRHSR